MLPSVHSRLAMAAPPEVRLSEKISDTLPVSRSNYVLRGWEVLCKQETTISVVYKTTWNPSSIVPLFQERRARKASRKMKQGTRIMSFSESLYRPSQQA